MLARLAIVAGLAFGVAAAGLVLGGLFALAPEPPLPSVAPPSAPVASAAPSVVASAVPSGSAGPSESAAPSGSASPRRSAAPSPEPSDSAFHVDQPTRPLVVPQAAWISYTATGTP